MSKMRCPCGAILSNVQSPCPTEGYLLGERAFFEFTDRLADAIVEFGLVCQTERRSAWIVERFGPQYPADITDAEVIADLLHGSLWQQVLSVAECIACGRLLVQTAPDLNEYRAYAPDESGAPPILKMK